MKLNLKWWLQCLWPLTVRAGDKKLHILTTFGMNFFIYFFLIHLYWWIAGIDPVRKYWFEPLLPRLELKLSANTIKQEELHR